MIVLTRREAAAVARLVEAVVCPAPPLPPVRETDAVAAFDAWLAHSPPTNRSVLRAAVLVLGGRSHRRLRPALARQLAEGLRSAAALAYYGDAAVMRTLGYDAAERVRAGALARPANEAP